MSAQFPAGFRALTVLPAATATAAANKFLSDQNPANAQGASRATGAATIGVIEKAGKFTLALHEAGQPTVHEVKLPGLETHQFDSLEHAQEALVRTFASAPTTAFE